MKRKILAAAMAGLVIGGCSHSRSARPPGVEGEPVGLAPAPSIYDTINRGTNAGVAKSTLPDPANPNWSGAPLIARRPETGLAPRVAAADGSARPASAAPAPARTRWSEPPRELHADATATATADAPGDADGPDDGPGLPPAAEADPTPAATPPDEAMPDLPALPAADHATPAVAPAPAPAGADLAEDPLLGPSPELMPAMEPSAAEPAQAAPAKPKAPAPPDEPVPAVEAAPAEGAPALEAAPSAAAADPAPRGDAQIRTVSSTSAPAGADVDESRWKEAGRAAARVGDEVITLRELVAAVKETVRKQGGKTSQLSREEQNLVAKHVLAALIERTLMVQEAKHQLKNSEKQLMKIQETADKVWREQELPPLLRQHFVENEHQLRRKFDEEGRSLAALQSNFRQEFLAYAFVQQKIGDKVEVSLPDMLRYYEAHKADKANYRSPAVVWREILVDKSKHASPAEARARADALLARLRKGEPFAALAAAESDGPARIKAAGGLMETAPGSYVVAAVNQALDSLPLNSVSDVVEGPDSFHILVVESRRAGGPATFAELQDQIRTAVREEKQEQHRRELIASLRKKTVISTIFDGTDSDPHRALH